MASSGYSTFNAATLLARFDFSSHQDILHTSQLSPSKATTLLDRIYDYLQDHAPGSAEYPHVLRLLQDCCYHTGAFPTLLIIPHITFSRDQPFKRGGEATLYHGRMAERHVAVRELFVAARESEKDARHFAIQLVHREAIVHSQLHHPNILPFLGIYYEGASAHPLVILPFLERGSLEKLLADLNGKLMKQSDLIMILAGLARGLVYLHSRGPPIIHGDLQPGNVLINNLGNPVLCDFGLGRIRHEISRSCTDHINGGRLRFVAPELWDLAGSSQQSDVFALAMTYLNAWSGQPPFPEISQEWRVASELSKGSRPAKPLKAVVLGHEVEAEFWKLLESMWVHQASNRPLSGQVLDNFEHIFKPLKQHLPSTQPTPAYLPSDEFHISSAILPPPDISSSPRNFRSPHAQTALHNLPYTGEASQYLWDHRPENLCLSGTREAVLNALINWAEG
ncbi:kinase-like protein, partial [Clavulina sp. PMI_390]